MTLRKGFMVRSGPSIVDFIPLTDIERDEDGDITAMSHLLGAKCSCDPEKVPVSGSPFYAGVVEVRFYHHPRVGA